MRRFFRWFRIVLLSLAAVVVLAVVGLYAASEWIVRRPHDAPAVAVAVPAGAAAIAEGERLARIRGCVGCHGDRLEGGMFIDDPLLARIAAPNLTQSVARHSDAELERIIRQGVRPDGRSVAVMPSSMYVALSDEDLGHILAYLRSVPAVEGQGREMRLGPLGRLGLLIGRYDLEVTNVSRAKALDASYPVAPEPHARGAYLARTVCTECHGLALEGGDRTPALAVARAYSLEDFTTLMRTGVALGGRELDLMTPVARSRFANLSDEEIAALHAFLAGRGGPVATDGP